MSSSPTPAPQKLTAIQLIEQELSTFIRQREQAIANVHAVEGAIQASERLLAKLKQAAAEAEAEAKKLVGEAKTEVVKLVGEADAEATKVEGEVKTEASKIIEFVKKEI